MQKLSGVLTVHNCATVTWKIDSFYELIEKGEQFKIESSTFNVGQQQLRLRLYNYIWYSNRYFFSIQSVSTFDKLQCILQCILMFQKVDGTSFKEKNSTFTFNKVSQDSTKIFSKDELLVYKDTSNEDGSLNILCCLYSKLGTNKTEKHQEEFMDHSREVSSQAIALEAVETLSDNLKALFVSGNHADVKIKVGSREFRAHKFLLAARSPVLNSMFSSDMLENNSGVLNVTDCDEDAFEGFLVFVYSGKLEEISSEKVPGVYIIADKYNLTELKRECIKRMLLDMSIDSICGTLSLAVVYEEKGLFDISTTFFIENAEKVLNTSKWENFLVDHPMIGNELFKKSLKHFKMK